MNSNYSDTSAKERLNEIKNLLKNINECMTLPNRATLAKKMIICAAYLEAGARKENSVSQQTNKVDSQNLEGRPR